MKLSLKLCLATVALVLFGVAIGMFGASFIDVKTVVLKQSSVNSLVNGFEIAFQGTDKGLESGQTLGTLFAFIFVVLGALASCYGVFFALTHNSKKGKKGNKGAKYLCAACTFVVCGLVPGLLLFLTLQTTNTAASASAFGGLLGGNTQLGIGAIVAAICSLLGGCSLSLAELSK